jgi:hypothetical protein
VKIYFLVFLIALTTVWMPELVSANDDPPAEDCSVTFPRDFNALSVPAQFREQVLFWLRRVDPDGHLTGVEFLRDKATGNILQAGDALIVRHHGHLKIVAPNAFGSALMPSERPLEGDEVSFATKINNLYIVKTHTYEASVPRDKGAGPVIKSEHLALLQSELDASSKEERFTADHIVHHTVPNRSGEVFTFNDELIYVSRIGTKTTGSEDPFKNLVIKKKMGGEIRECVFETLADMPVLKVEYGNARSETQGEQFYTYHKGFVSLFNSKGSHQAITFQLEGGPKRYLIVNRYKSLKDGAHSTEVIEAFPDRQNTEPVYDIYEGSFMIGVGSEAVLTTDRFAIFRINWHQFSDLGDTNYNNIDGQLVLSDPKNRRIRSKLTQSMFPFMPNVTGGSRLGTTVLLAPERLLEDDPNLLVVRTDLHAANRTTKTPEGLTILHRRDELIQFQKYSESSSGELKTPTSEFRSDLSIYASHRVVSVDREPQFGGNLLSVRFDVQGKPSPFVLLIDPITHERVVIPDFERVVKYTFRGVDSYFIFGRIGNTNRVAFTLYDASTRKFQNTEKYNPNRAHDGHSYFPEQLKFGHGGDFLMPQTIAGQDIKSVSITRVPETSWVSFDLANGQRGIGKPIRYLMDLSASESRVTLEDPREIDITGESHYTVLVGRARRKMNGSKDKNTEKFDNQSTLIFIPRKKGESDYTYGNIDNRALAIVFRGQVDTLNFVSPRYIEANGNITHLGHVDTVEYHHDMRSEGDGLITLINKDSTVLFEDVEDGYKVVRTLGSVDTDPQLYFYNTPEEGAHVGEWEEIDLMVPKTVTMKVQVLFFTEEVEQVVMVPNTQQIKSVTREGNFLFIKTTEDEGRPSQTYVYNLHKDEVVFSIPNLVKHFDVGNYRFYVGNSGPFNATNVVVTKLDTGERIEVFDFGKTKIKTDDSNCIRYDEDRHAVVFKTTTGHERIYDLKHRHFFGLLPDKVSGVMDDLSELGSVLNRKVFEGHGHQTTLLCHDETFRKVERQFQIAKPDAGSQYAMLIGENGTGRSTFMNEYVSRYIAGSLSPMPQHKLVFFSLNPSSVSAGTMYRGTGADKYQKLNKSADALIKQGYRLIVVIDDMDSFKRQSWTDDEDFFTQFRVVMKERNFDILATATPSGFEQLVRDSDGMMSDFYTVRLDPMSQAQTHNALTAYLRDYRQPVIMDTALLRSMVERVQRLQVHKQLPGSAFDLLKRILKSNSEEVEPGQPITVTRQDVNEHLAEQSGVPQMFFDPETRQVQMPKLLAYLQKRVRNQDKPIEHIWASLVAFAMEISRGDWPIFRAFFLGPTGVGKTEVIRAVVAFVFGGDSSRLLTINGPEYSGSVVDVRKLSKLIVEHIKRHPFNAILIDEFEKMHSDAQNIVLALGDGALTDESGRSVSSSLTMLFATSNLGATEAMQAASRRLGFSQDAASALVDMRSEYEKALERDIRPEVINRFDIVEIFNSLDEVTATSIIDDYLNADANLATRSIKSRLADQNIFVEFDSSVISRAVERYLDVRFGARRLASRVESQIVERFIAIAMLNNEIVPHKRYLITFDLELETYKANEISESLDQAAGDR